MTFSSAPAGAFADDLPGPASHMDPQELAENGSESQQIHAERVGLQLKGFEGTIYAYKVTTGMAAAITV